LREPRVNEFELIGRHFARTPRHDDVKLGVGDDAAIVAPASGVEYAVSVDMLVEGRHFAPGTNPEDLGHKALAVNLSDMAAMGATPRFVLLAGALPVADDAWLSAFMRGFDNLAARYDVELIGGDTTCGPLNLCVTIIGEVPAGRAIMRAGAAAGDTVFVSGHLGDAALALAVREGRVRADPPIACELAQRLDRPEPRVALGIALRGIASSALDVSDGLVGDLAHILDASRVGAVVDIAAMPASDALRTLLDGPQRDLALACLLAGGDDYELCFTAPATMQPALETIARSLDLPVAAIGAITATPGLVVCDERGRRMPALPRAFDHFR
jgi:thiamine-monophosphate kinase